MQKKQVNRARVQARAQKRAAEKKAPPTKPQPKPSPPPTDPAESTGLRPGPCPLCKAKVAYDEDDRMNEHRFKGFDATCVMSDRVRGWFPETIEAAVPRRLRTGERVPPKDHNHMRQAVGLILGARNATARAAKRDAHLMGMTKEQRERAKPWVREVSGGAPGLGKRR